MTTTSTHARLDAALEGFASRRIRYILRVFRGPTCTRIWRCLRALCGDSRKLGGADAVVEATRDTRETRDPARLIQALARANASSCYETAARLVQRLRRELAGLDPQLRRKALPSVVEAMLVVGDEAGIADLVEEFSVDFVRSRRALDLAAPSLCGRVSDAESFTAAAQRRLRAPLLATRWESGQLSRDELLRLLARHPLRVAMDPMLELVVFNVLKEQHPDLATRALNRFLAAYGLRPLRLSDGLGPFLGRLSASRDSTHGVDGPLVSVIVAAHNARRTVEYAINSLLAQSYENTEILVCDDASADGSFDVLARCYAPERRVRLFRSLRRQGTYNIRNHLIQFARGRLLTFHDADDWSLPDRLAIQVRALRPGGMVACLSSWVRLREDGTVVFFRNGAPVRMSAVSLMASRELFLSCGPFRTARFGADFEFCQTLRARYGEQRIARVQAPLIFSLWSDSSLTRTAGAEALETGYRSPARRAYCELVSQRILHGSQVTTDEAFTVMLRRHNNYVEPTGVVEVLGGSKPPGFVAPLGSRPQATRG